MQVRIAAFAAAMAVFASLAEAQTAPPPAPPAARGPAVAATPKAKAAERCMRLPLSDVAFGTENSTKAAREKLAEYAEVERKKRKWPDQPLVQSKETVSCEVYLNLGPLGTEYRCLVTTTFCQK